jgi:hypothetical protein
MRLKVLPDGLTADEINKIYGFKEGTPRQKKLTPNGLVDEDGNPEDEDC